MRPPVPVVVLATLLAACQPQPPVVYFRTSTRVCGLGDPPRCRRGLNVPAETRSSELIGPAPASVIDEVVSAATGRGFTCATTRRGVTACWGRNDKGQTGSRTPCAVPIYGEFTVPEDAVEVVAGDFFACVRTALGNVWCSGAMGEPGSGAPRRVAVSEVRLLAAGARTACAVDASEQVACWGDDHVARRVAVDQSIGTISRLGCGSYQCCALGAAGALRCWTAETAGEPMAAESPGFDGRYDRLAIGGAVTCGRRMSEWWCGAGPGSRLARMSWPNVDEVYAGSEWLCTVERDTASCYRMPTCPSPIERGGRVLCPTPVQRGWPTLGAPVPFARAAAVAAAGDHVCVVSNEGVLTCAGSARVTQIALGEHLAAVSPRPIDVPGRVRRIAVGSSHVCAGDRALWCWGHNASGQLGAGDLVGHAGVVRVLGVEDVADIAASARHTCAIGRGGRTWCWGDNSVGQVGAPTGQAWARPREIPGLRALAVAVGEQHTCALEGRDEASCWGRTVGARLGRRLPMGSIASPVPVDLGDLPETIRGSGNHTCVLSDSGVLTCWGGEDSRDAILERVHAGWRGPVAVSADVVCGFIPDVGIQCRHLIAGLPAFQVLSFDSPIIGLVAGEAHFCGLFANHRVACWGNNEAGQLGRGFRSRHERVPEVIRGLSNVEDVAAGGAVTCAVVRAGGVRCWGANDQGQVGVFAGDPAAAIGRIGDEPGGSGGPL